MLDLMSHISNNHGKKIPTALVTFHPKGNIPPAPTPPPLKVAVPVFQGDKNLKYFKTCFNT